VAPITAKNAVAKLQEAIDYADDSINEVMSTLGGTTPPPRTLMPDLYQARDMVVNARGAIKSLADRTPDVEVSPNYVATGVRLGTNLIDAANEAMDRAKKSDSPAELATTAAKSAVHMAEGAAKGLIKLGGFMLTPMEALFGAILIDEIFNQGKIRRSIIGGGSRKGKQRG
jgi:hypothetical protein